jgi:hypothetical protein
LGLSLGAKALQQDMHSETLTWLTQLREKHIADGHNTLGKPQKNAVAIQIRTTVRNH